MEDSKKVFEVACYIKNNLHKKGVEPSTIQIIKLVYIAFGIHGSKTNLHLFEDEIQAWQYGPVIPNLYHQIKNDNLDILGKYENNNLSQEELKSIDDTLGIYGNLKSFQLINKTHSHGSPWSNYYKEGVMDAEIDKNEIINHYKQIKEIKSFLFANKEIFVSLKNK